ncbi:hypothetical protein EN789_33620, partial [bacterium M00.F.Ca.ET.146.01.1.1]
MKNRFEAIANPSCRFDIWDNENDEPVVHHDRLLSFAKAQAAARIAGFLNDMAAAAWAEPASGKIHPKKSQVENIPAKRSDRRKTSRFKRLDRDRRAARGRKPWKTAFSQAFAAANA